jgi:hypothetical protein
LGIRSIIEQVNKIVPTIKKIRLGQGCGSLLKERLWYISKIHSVSRKSERFQTRSLILQGEK